MNQLQTVLDALENSIGLVQGEYYEAVERYGGLSHKKSYVDGFAELIASHKEAIEIVKQMMQAEPVAWELFFDNGNSNGFTTDKGEAAEFGENKRPLYAAPQATPVSDEHGNVKSSAGLIRDGKVDRFVKSHFCSTKGGGMTHTIDTLMALADRYRDLKVGEGTAQTREAIHAALTEALDDSEIRLQDIAAYIGVGGHNTKAACRENLC
jgi:hypothetical protein